MAFFFCLIEYHNLILCSDGLSQAGIGITTGIGVEGIADFITEKLTGAMPMDTMLDMLLKESYYRAGNNYSDDTTLVVLTATSTHPLNILTGPPLLKQTDALMTEAFIKLKGKKVICGSTTSEIVSRELDEPLTLLCDSFSKTHLPYYTMPGIDLITEGAITLNQLLNIIDEPDESYDNYSCVSDLAKMLKESDVVNLYIGKADNIAHRNISFKQSGILRREHIVRLLIEKLESMGKLVTTLYW